MFSLILFIFAFVFGAKPFLDHNTTAFYWGQDTVYAANYGVYQERLREYCNAEVDIIILSFVVNMGSGREVLLNFANQGDHGEVFPGTQLLHLPEIGEDIKYCQSLGKQVLLSLGGAVGSYDFSSVEDARTTAGLFHDMFGAGQTGLRPFDDAVIDGYDLDIEGGKPNYWSDFVARTREIEQGVIISAAPQCVYPDAILDDALSKVGFDYLFIQFYNNWCRPGYWYMNYDEWDTWANTKSINKNIRLFFGTPACERCSGGGYVGFKDLKLWVDKCKVANDKKFEHFGGISMWDVTAGVVNKDGSTNGMNYAQFAKYTLGLEPDLTVEPEKRPGTQL